MCHYTSPAVPRHVMKNHQLYYYVINWWTTIHYYKFNIKLCIIKTFVHWFFPHIFLHCQLFRKGIHRYLDFVYLAPRWVSNSNNLIKSKVIIVYYLIGNLLCKWNCFNQLKPLSAKENVMTTLISTAHSLHIYYIVVAHRFTIIWRKLNHLKFLLTPQVTIWANQHH